MHAVLVEGQRLANAAVRRTAVLNSLLSHVDPGPRVKGFEGIAPLMCPCCVEDVTGTEGPALAGTYLAAAASVPHDADGLCLGGLRPLRCAHAFSRDQVVCQNE
jgi:hypothetical protein